MKQTKLFAWAFVAFFGFTSTISAQTSRFWKEIEKSSYLSEREWMPDVFKSYLLNPTDLKNMLAPAPYRPIELGMTRGEGIEIELPISDGTFQHFRLVESPIMEKGLADHFPNVKTYAGYGVEDPTAYIRCDFTQYGFHAYILSEKGTLVIDPYSLNTQNEYIVYYKQDVSHPPLKMECQLHNEEEEQINNVKREISNLGQNVLLPTVPSTQKSFAGQLRTYRLALACTGEYAAKFGGTKAGAFAAMTTTMNRVNGVFEKEVNVHMTMIANDTLLIYTNASTDPYTNSNGSTMLGENKTNINAVIGTANYDMGHVFSTGGGGIAQLGCICGSNKAQGVTGSSSPSGDGYDIDYVAHEMGHQFAGNHTFNCTTGSCGGGNRNNSTAYEPGSGITIMAYAGICNSTNDLAAHSIDIFHTKSFDEITTFIVAGGNSCAVKTATNNGAPVVTVPAQTYFIPFKTPFKLTASATDPEGDALTYTWEQFDLGPSGNWNAPTGNAPLFMTFKGTSDPTRLFPKRATILAGLFQSLGEVLPTYARDMSFRCTVRDNKVGGGGVTYNDATVDITVVNTTNPFKVNTANTTGVTWAQNSTQTVTWDVANTTAAPISCANVNILLSTDGGQTFPTLLVGNTPNDGNEVVTVPGVLSTTARILVESVGNIFFDINDKNFAIGLNAIDLQQFADQVSVFPNPSKGDFAVDATIFEGKEVSVEIVDMLGKTIQKLSPNNAQFNVDLQNETSGVYLMRINVNDGVLIKKLVKE